MQSQPQAGGLPAQPGCGGLQCPHLAEGQAFPGLVGLWPFHREERGWKWRQVRSMNFLSSDFRFVHFLICSLASFLDSYSLTPSFSGAGAETCKSALPFLDSVSVLGWLPLKADMARGIEQMFFAQGGSWKQWLGTGEVTQGREGN